MANLVANLVWIQELLKKLRVGVETSIVIHSDNESTIQIIVNPMFHKRTIHIEFDYYFIWGGVI